MMIPVPVAGMEWSNEPYGAGNRQSCRFVLCTYEWCRLEKKWIILLLCCGLEQSTTTMEMYHTVPDGMYTAQPSSCIYTLQFIYLLVERIVGLLDMLWMPKQCYTGRFTAKLKHDKIRRFYCLWDYLSASRLTSHFSIFIYKKIVPVRNYSSFTFSSTRRCLDTLPATQLTTASSSPTLAQQDRTRLTLVRFSSVGWGPICATEPSVRLDLESGTIFRRNSYSRTCQLVMQPFQTVAENIFVWSAGSKRVWVPRI